MLIQVLLLAFFFFALIKVFIRWRAGVLSLTSLIGWTVFWLAAGAVALLPNSTAQMAKLVGIGRGADLVVYVALAGLFFLIFKLMVKIEQMNKDITTLTRKIALNESANPPIPTIASRSERDPRFSRIGTSGESR